VSRHFDPLSAFVHALHQLKIALFNLALFIIFVVGLYAFLKHEVASFLDYGNHTAARPDDTTAARDARSP